MLLFSGLWLPRLGNLPLPVLSLLYWTVRLSAFPSFPVKLLVQPFLCLSLTLLVFFVHLDNPQVDQLLSFSRIVLPHIMAVLSIICCAGLSYSRYIRIVRGFMLMIIVLALVDLSPYLLEPRAALLAQANPYEIKSKTLLFLDSNWIGFFLGATDTVARLCLLNRRAWWRFGAPLLALLSGSRSSLIYFLLVNLADFALPMIGPLRRYLVDWARLPLYNRRISSMLVSALLGVPLSFPLFALFIFQDGQILPASGDSVSLSTQDGSFQTKMQIASYAVAAIDTPSSLLVGNGPKVVKVATNYTGHSLIGFLPEIGLLGVLSFLLPLFISVYREPSLIVPMASLCLLSSTSFFPIAYMAPFLMLWSLKVMPSSLP
jgi:hypothetical protein